MCQLGRSNKRVLKIKKQDAVTAFKVMVDCEGELSPLVFSSTSFERLRGDYHHSFTTRYHFGGTFRTDPPDVNAHDSLGNARGFWAWGKKELATVRTGYVDRRTYEVRMWGRVVKHRLGYRAEYMKIVRRVK